MARSLIGIGSNCGDRAGWISRALEALQAAGLTVGRVSSLYLTEPVGDAALPWFVNAAAEILEPPAPPDLIDTCLQIEARCGRLRHGDVLEARSLDLDVLLYDQRVIHEPRLTVPHPRMHERRFVLQPLAEIAAAAVVPTLRSSVAHLLAALTSPERVWLLAPPPVIGTRTGPDPATIDRPGLEPDEAC